MTFIVGILDIFIIVTCEIELFNSRPWVSIKVFFNSYRVIIKLPDIELKNAAKRSRLHARTQQRLSSTEGRLPPKEQTEPKISAKIRLRLG